MDKEMFNLTYPQKNIWLVEETNEKLPINVISGAININSRIDKKICNDALNEIIKINEALRFNVSKNNNGEVFQILKEYNYEKFQIIEFKNYENAKEYIEKFSKESINIYSGNLYDFKILRYNDGTGTLLLKAHHIVLDAWSAGLVVSQVINYIESKSKNCEFEISNINSYKEYINTENEYKNSAKYEKDSAFFDEYINGYNEIVTLKNNTNITNKANRYSVKLTKEINDKITQFCKDNRISPYVLFLTALNIYLYRIKGKNDIIIGTPVLNRTNFLEKNMVGMFVSTQPLRTKINENSTFFELAKGISLNTLSLFRHQRYPYYKILEKVHKEKEIKYNLYDIVLSYQNARANIENKEKYNTVWPFNGSIDQQLQIHIMDLDNTGILNINYDYLEELFDEVEIKYLHTRLMQIIQSAMENVNISIEDIEIMTKEEKNKILNDFNNTYVDYPKNKSVIELFEEQVKKTPNNIALVYKDKKVTYKELNDNANALAHYLLNHLKLNELSTVGIMLKRSFELITAILACLKCRIRYVPIERTEPVQRRNYIIKNSKLSTILTDISDEESYLTNIVNINLEKYSRENLNLKYNSEDDVYIMYTSGTTGNPKGVIVSNRNIVRLIKGANYIEVDQNDKIVQTGSPSFDATTFEYWIALLNGLPLHIMRKNELLDINYLKQYVNSNNITIMWLSAPLYNQIVDTDIKVFDSVKKLLVGGDALSVKHINKLINYKPDIKIINGYGPTENTTFSLCHEIKKIYESNIPIGKPISNSRCYVVDSKCRLLPIGIEGELIVAGDGVSKGYLDNTELTSKKFIHDLFENDNLYKTGDICKFNFNGEVEFIGREDFQVKINGYRVELNDIKIKMQKIDGIEDVLIYVNNENGNKKIIAIYSTTNEILKEEIIEELKKQLPFYEIPKLFIEVEEIPLNKNGKVDTLKLKELIHKYKNIENKDVKDKFNYEGVYKEIYKIYARLLKKEDILPDDNFFEMGGDSLLAIQFVTESVSRNVNITYSEFYKNPTIKLLGDYVTNKLNNNISISNDIEVHDYTKVDELLSDNFKNKNLSKDEIGNVLLTGVTGFLGAHILDEFMKYSSNKIYCLVRKKDDLNVEERLKGKLNYFFGNKYDDEFGKRIFIVEGDMFSNDIFFNDSDYDTLVQNVSTIINSAANVKHFGNFDEFKKINELGVKNLAEFCVKNNKKLIHISTLSVSGNILETGQVEQKNIKEDTEFNEKHLFIGQDLDNVYAYSKFLGEKIVLDYIAEKGLKASIMRMGNLTGRLTDGKFQPNVEDNAFSNRIKTFIELGVIPDNILDFYLEFTPIDLAARAIILLSEIDSKYSCIYHLFNHNHVNVTEVVEIFKSIGINLKEISKKEMTNVIRQKSNESDGYKKIKGIVLDINDSQEIDYHTKIIVKSSYTIDTLKMLNFEWPTVISDYIIKYMENLFNIGFIKRKREK